MFLFVYGTLKKGQCNHARFGFNKSTLIGEAIVRNFALVQAKALQYPFMIPEMGRYVTGEVYEVPMSVIADLDRMEKGAGYERHIIKTDAGREVYTYVDCTGFNYPEFKRFSTFPNEGICPIQKQQNSV